MKKNIKKPSFFPRNIKLPWATSKPKRNYEVDLAEWFNHAVAQGWISGFPNPLIADYTVDMQGYTWSFGDANDTSTGGELTAFNTLLSGKEANIRLGVEDIIVGTDSKGSGLVIADPITAQASVAVIGDFTGIGQTADPDGYLFGTLSFAGSLGTAVMRGSVNTTTGEAQHLGFAEVQAGFAGDASWNNLANVLGTGDAFQTNQAFSVTGNATAALNSRSQGAGATATTDINATNTVASGASEIRLITSNTADSINTSLRIQQGQMLYVGNNGATTRWVMPDDIGATKYATDGDAGVGGITTGTLYFRTTGELAIKL